MSLTLCNNNDEGDKTPAVVLVTGGTGLVGQAVQKVQSELAAAATAAAATAEEAKEIVECAESSSSSTATWIFVSSKDVDLRDKDATFEYFQRVKPTKVLHLAAIVGGLFKNMR